MSSQQSCLGSTQVWKEEVKLVSHRVKLRLPENVERPMEISSRSHTLTVMKCTKQCDVLAELLFYLLNPLILFLSVVAVAVVVAKLLTCGSIGRIPGCLNPCNEPITNLILRVESKDSALV